MFYGVLADLLLFETFWFKRDFNLLVLFTCVYAFKKPTLPHLFVLLGLLVVPQTMVIDIALPSLIKINS